MPKFTYVSRDAGGQRITAMADAASRHELIGQLKERGQTVVEVRELEARETSPEAAHPHAKHPALVFSQLSFGSITTGELAIFWRELATMVSAGLPIVEALESISHEMEHVRLRKVLTHVTSSMWEGFSLSQSLRQHQDVFSPMTIALMAAAEESGSLPEVATHLATYLENRDRIIRKVRAALTYPIFLCGFFLVVIAVATFWIIPKFRDIYEGFGAQLPQLTQIVFSLNAFVLAKFPWLVAITVALLVAGIWWARTPAGRMTLHRISLKLPIFGPLLQRAAVARLFRALSILLSGGIPINRALEMAQWTSGNSVVAQAVAASREQILKGAKISTSFKEHHVFPQMAVRMVAAGEESGSLSSLLEKVADFYESRVDAALTTVNSLIEPIMIIIVGAFVLIFVLSMYLPIFKLAATMRG